MQPSKTSVEDVLELIPKANDHKLALKALKLISKMT